MTAERRLPGSKAARAALAALTLLLGASVLNAMTGFDAGPLAWLIEKWAYNVVLVGAGLACLARGLRVALERSAWLTIGAAVLGWALGNVYYTAVLWELDPIPIPSLSDVSWLVYYPVVYVGVALLMRARIARFHASLWVVWAVAALAVGALSAALVFQPVLTKHTGEGAALEVATNLAYPVGDLVLLGMVTGGVALTGWKPGVTWGALAVSFLIFGVSDGIYLIGNARGTWEAGSLVEAGWPAATLLLAWAAWMRPQDKPGRLDPDEWAFIARHTLIGERILGAAQALPPVACLVRSSHEHFDGNGYPDGLRGTEIPLGARIVAVCDAYDAMTSDRPYRSRMTHAEAIAELQRCAGSQFDPVVVRAFCAAEHSAAGLAATPGV